MGENIGNVDKELEEKDNKIRFSENKIGISDDIVVEEMNNLASKKIYHITKCYKIMYRLIKTLNNHKNNQN